MHRLKNDLNLISLAARHTQIQIEEDELISALEGIEQIQQAAGSLAAAVKAKLEERGQEEIYRVLLAEDNPNQRILIGNALRKAGFFVAEVADGNQAIEYLYEMTVPDIILTDLGMPHCDGRELINVARTSPMCSHALIVVITARPLTDEMQEHVDHVVMKPMDPKALVNELKQLLLQQYAADSSSSRLEQP